MRAEVLMDFKFSVESLINIVRFNSVIANSLSKVYRGRVLEIRKRDDP